MCNNLQCVGIVVDYLPFRAVKDLPTVKQWANASQEEPDRLCSKICAIATHVLALSLLEPPLDTVRLRLDSGDHVLRGTESERHADSLYELVHTALYQRCNSRPFEVTPYLLISHLLRILGHEGGNTAEERCIAWSFEGQVIFSSLIERMELGKGPCMQFVCVPGVLVRQDKESGLALQTIKGEQRSEVPVEDFDTTYLSTSQVSSLSAFNSMDPTWKYHVEGDCMLIHLAKKFAVDAYTRVSPVAILEQCARTLITPACSHPLDQLDGDVTEDYAFVHPNSFLLERFSMGREVIKVYAVRGNDPLRMMILGTLFERLCDSLVVVGGDACLSCSLNLCRRANVQYLVT